MKHSIVPAILTLVAAVGLSPAQAESSDAQIPRVEVGIPREDSPQPVPRRLSDEEKALLEIQERGREAVRLLADRSKTAGPAEQVEIQRQIEAVKRQTRIEFLERIIEFAAAKGRSNELELARQQLERLVEGPPRPQTPVSRPAPLDAREAGQ